LEDAVAESDRDVRLVSGQLEVHRPTRVLGLTLELAAWDVHADDQRKGTSTRPTLGRSSGFSEMGTNTSASLW
jgi:hypothetical protein